MPFGIAPELFTGTISSVLGLAAVVTEVRGFSLAFAAEEWPTVEGTVDSTGVETEYLSRNTTYAPRVRYHYEVGGRRYTGDRLWFGGPSSVSFRSWAEGIADHYAEQRRVTVHVSPTDPALSVLEPGTHWGGWVILCGGILFLGIGITGILSHWGIVTTSIQFK